MSELGIMRNSSGTKSTGTTYQCRTNVAMRHEKQPFTSKDSEALTASALDQKHPRITIMSQQISNRSCNNPNIVLTKEPQTLLQLLHKHEKLVNVGSMDQHRRQHQAQRADTSAISCASFSSAQGTWKDLASRSWTTLLHRSLTQSQPFWMVGTHNPKERRNCLLSNGLSWA